MPVHAPVPLYKKESIMTRRSWRRRFHSNAKRKNILNILAILVRFSRFLPFKKESILTRRSS
ncbi:MAG: hypothetical protein GY859_22465 [Desulfobacterales bacterium]|nr:hypothetical protein [Desulfobacterales bacterium]